MRLLVLPIGRLRDRQLQSLCDGYIKRLRPLIPIEVADCRDIASQWTLVHRAEAWPIVLDERGQSMTTPHLAAWLQDLRDRGTGTAAFLIGDAHGYGDRDRSRARAVLSLSTLTLPHRIVQLVLLEQLYRVATIWHGHPYHHA